MAAAQPMARLALLCAGLCLGLLSPALAARTAQPSSAISSDMRPIRKVITLIQEMKEQVEKDAEADALAYEKYMCWCTTNRKEKTAAISNAEQRIEKLGTLLEESAAKEGSLKTEIAGLKDDISSDDDALATATSVRDEEKKAFLAEEADMKETIALLGEAIGVLGKVQLLQKQGRGAEKESRQAASMLLQVRHIIEARFPNYRDTMQRDLFDVLGAFPAGAQEPHTYLRKGEATAFQQAQLLPWEKTEEQLGQEANPNDLTGQAASSKSYNSRSGGILGLLKEMGAEFGRDLAAAQKNDFQSEVEFQKLRAAKLAEIAAATKQKDRKEAALAETLDTAAKAEEDKESTQAAMAADGSFMGTLEENCKTEDEEYKARLAVRSEELRALAETLKILTEDSARELYAKTESFVQTGAVSVEQAAAQERVRKAVQHIATAAKKSSNWALASLAVRMQLDAFTKVKETMDKMLAELQKQQKDEYAKMESCKKNIDETEDSIKEGENLKEDLAEKHLAVSDEIATLESEIEELKKDVADMEVSLKQAGEERKAQNAVFQTSVADQRATTNILQKALERLKAFYSFSQQEPGAPAPPPPASGKAYEKSAGSGGVMQLLAKVIKDAEVAEQTLAQDEQKAQEDYGAFVQTASASIEADRTAIRQKEMRAAQAASEKSETEEGQLANGEDLAKLADILQAHHLECDYLIKYFDLRQQARAEEMDAIKDAKAILSGSKFE
mmetsp:Transcript_44117/g.105576  ORF Transcript_44117/g.105576 Transcript_44117/m.105576 type:complete len:731 (-) Transcript_44117:93-2285(-)